MTKRLKLFIIIAVSLIIIIFIFRSFPFGYNQYKISSDLSKITLPKFSYDIKNEQKGIITFKSHRSKFIIQDEINDMFESYDKYICNNKVLYYDKDHNITFMDYEISYRFFTNNIKLIYHSGKFSDNECAKVFDYKQMDYRIIPVNSTGHCYIKEDKFEYRDENNELHNVYYECFGNLAFKNGMNKMEYIDRVLFFRWISMKDIINYLNYKTKDKTFTKKIIDKKHTLYYNNDFYLLKCDNKDIYIGAKYDEFKSYCN